MSRFFSPPTLIMILVLGYMAISGGRFSNPGDWLFSTLLVFPGIIIALSFHEFAHAAVAYRLGDNTPKFQGRVTLNPLAHLDPIGLICIIFIGFGWGKPVMIDPRNFMKPRRDDLFVSLAGVTTNFILAFVFGAVLWVLSLLVPMYLEDKTVIILTSSFLVKKSIEIIPKTIKINLVLMVFNLLPVPPLDGFNVVTEIFNIKYTELYYKIYEKGFFILMALMVLGIVSTIIEYTVYPLYYFILGIFL